jgi:hypothetical protein
LAEAVRQRLSEQSEAATEKEAVRAKRV